MTEIITPDPDERPIAVYADAARKVPLTNPVRANAAGIFPPIYLEPDVTHRVRLLDTDGNLILDLDPYECQCGFLLLTSNLYPFEWIDSAIGAGGAVPIVRYDPDWIDGAGGTGGVISAMISPLISYDDWPEDEAIGVGGSLSAGTMIAPLISYDDWPEDEAIGIGGSVVAGTMIAPLINYSNWPADASIGVGGSMVAGSLN